MKMRNSISIVYQFANQTLQEFVNTFIFDTHVYITRFKGFLLNDKSKLYRSPKKSSHGYVSRHKLCSFLHGYVKIIPSLRFSSMPTKVRKIYISRMIYFFLMR